MVVSASTNQVWTKITIGSYAHVFCHSESDTSGVLTDNFLPKTHRIYNYFYEFASEAMHIVIFENLVNVLIIEIESYT